MSPQKLAIHDTMNRLKSAQKSGDGVPAYTRYVNRRLARVPVAVAARLGMSPNQMTLLSLVFTGTGLGLVAFGTATPAGGAVIALLLLVGFVLDSADGQLARVQQSGGPRGEWLDHVVDAVRGPAVHAMVLIGLYRGALAGPRSMLLVPIFYQLMATGHFFSQILAEQLRRQAVLMGRLEGRPVDWLTPAPAGQASFRPHSLARSIITLPVDTGVLCALFFLWGWPNRFYVGYLALLVLSLPIVVSSVMRKYQTLDRIQEEMK